MFQVKGQTIITVSDSLSQLPITDVLISANSNNTITDSFGSFDLDIFNENDTLLFQHVNYFIKKLAYKDLVGIKKIRLQQKTFLEEEITISDKHSEFSNKESIEIGYNEKLTTLSPADLIDNNLSMLVKDYGGRAALKTVSVRGLSSENTIVLFNEAKVNDISTGGFDFSKLSSVSIDKIEYLKSSLQEPTSSGGVLKLFSGNFDNNNAKSFGYKYGSENYNSFFTTINHKLNNFSFQLRGERSYSPNNFNYNFEGKDFKRENAFFNKSFFSFNTNYSDQRNVVRIYFHYSYLHNGIPGYVVTNNHNSSRAINNNRTYLPILNYTFKINDNLFLQSTLHSHFQKLALSDDQKNIIVNNDKKDSDLFDGSADIKLAWDNSKLSSFLEFQFEYGELRNKYFADKKQSSEDFSKRKSNIATASTNYLIQPEGGIISSANLGIKVTAINTNEILNKKNENTFVNYEFNLGINPSFSDKLSFGFSVSKNNRFPTFNERYYSNLFDNIKLNNEKYTSLDFGAAYKNNNSEASINFYTISGTDRIIWVPTRLALQTPKNIGEVQTRGIEFSGKQNFLNNKINLSIIYTLTDAKNKSDAPNSNSYNKQIVYIPKHKIRSNITFSISNIMLKTDLSFSSESFFTSDNNPINKLDSYFIINQSLLYDFYFYNWQSTIALTIYNIFSEKYLVVQSYPMPLRSFNLSFLVELK